MSGKGIFTIKLFGLRLRITREAQEILEVSGVVLPSHRLPIVQAEKVTGHLMATVSDTLKKYHGDQFLDGENIPPGKKTLVVMDPVPNKKGNALSILAFFKERRGYSLRPVKAQKVVSNGRVVNTLMIHPEDRIMVLDFAS